MSILVQSMISSPASETVYWQIGRAPILVVHLILMQRRRFPRGICCAFFIGVKGFSVGSGMKEDGEEGKEEEKKSHKFAVVVRLVLCDL